MTDKTPTESSSAPAKAPKVPRHGVDTPTLLATINAVGAQPALGEFRFRASNEWVSGTHSQSRPESFSGAGTTHVHENLAVYDADHPRVLVGTDEGPAPVEFLLYALASCLTAGVANIAAVRGVTLRSVRSTVEGDIDVRAILGLTNDVRNGFRSIRIRFAIDGDASPEVLREILEQSKRRSAVYDVLTNGVPVEVAVSATS